MNKKNLIFSIVLVFIMASSIFAHEPINNVEEFDIDSIDYIEDELEIYLDFNTADYLPEGFDPYAYYFDLDSVEYIEDENTATLVSMEYLPIDFDVYAYPTDFMSIDYIDVNDEILLDFDSKQNLPKNFDSYKRK